MTNPISGGTVTVKLYFNEGRPGQQGPAGPAGAVPAERKIATQAGSGLTGGGDLSADRYLAVDFGDQDDTVAEGSDPRFRGVPIVTESGSKTLDASHAGTLVKCTSGSAQTITIPSGVFDAGTIIEVMQYGAGQVTVAAGSGVTLRDDPAGGLDIAEQYGSLILLFLSGTEAVVTGAGA